MYFEKKEKRIYVRSDAFIPKINTQRFKTTFVNRLIFKYII